YALNAYVTQYYSTYDNYQAYYGAPYDGNNPGDQLFSLKAYINKRLSEDGISSGSKCYKYKGGRYNDTQLNKIAQSVMSESGVAQNLTLSVAGWKTVFTPYKRTL